jgi:hypothetical protein
VLIRHHRLDDDTAGIKIALLLMSKLVMSNNQFFFHLFVFVRGVSLSRNWHKNSTWNSSWHHSPITDLTPFYCSCFLALTQLRHFILRLLTAQDRVRSQVIPCRICDGQSATGTGFSPLTTIPLMFHTLMSIINHQRYVILAINSVIN